MEKSSEENSIILFVDQDWEDFAYLSEITDDCNYTLIWSRTADEAFEHLEKMDVDILMCDWETRDKDGQRLTSIIKSSSKWNGIYTFLIAEQKQIPDVVRAMIKGADDVLIKPINRQIFLARIHVALRMRKVLDDQSSIRHQEGIMETITAVAHEINNPLFAVLGNIDLLMDELQDDMNKPEGAFMKECLESINEQGERMAEVVRKLQTVTKPRTKEYMGEQRMLDLNTPTTGEYQFISTDNLTKKKALDDSSSS